MKHYTIPFFVLHKGCPNKCVFCDQNQITGQKKISPEEVSIKIEKYLNTIKNNSAIIEVGFFGGSFTALDKEYQNNLLDPVQPYIESGKISSIRLSTRPDRISKDILINLKEKHVKCIELGVQSADDLVLEQSKRGHTFADTVKASALILKEGFILGHQMMVGLPASSENKEYATAFEIKRAGASEVRIYPLLVIKGTELEDMWIDKKYLPLKEREAVERCAKLMMFFQANNINVIRCGLHPSEGLLKGSSFLAGPFHTAFGEKVRSHLFRVYLEYLKYHHLNIDSIEYNPKDKGALIGFEGGNKDLIKCLTGNIMENDEINRGELLFSIEGKKVLLDKVQIAKDYLPDLLKPAPKT